jgi:hypothetical protein
LGTIFSIFASTGGAYIKQGISISETGRAGRLSASFSRTWATFFEEEQLAERRTIANRAGIRTGFRK